MERQISLELWKSKVSESSQIKSGEKVFFYENKKGVYASIDSAKNVLLGVYLFENENGWFHE